MQSLKVTSYMSGSDVFALNALRVTINSYELKFKNEEEFKHCINTCRKYLLKVPTELTQLRCHEIRILDSVQ